MGNFVKGGISRVVRCLAAVILGYSFFLAAQAQTATRPGLGQVWTAQVTHVIDGDSLWVRTEEGAKRRKLRLYGIDAPEICQAHGPEARVAMEKLTRNQRVRVSVRAYDRYGRAIVSARRLSDDLDIASAMVSKGWAWNTAYRGRKGLYWSEEAKARKAGKGIFTQLGPESPTEFRRRHGPCKARP